MKPFYTLYFDAEGCGPTALELKWQVFETPPEVAKMRLDRGKPTEPPAIGLQFAKGGGFNLNDAPIGAGFYFSDRESIEELHRQLGELLASTAAK